MSSDRLATRCSPDVIVVMEAGPLTELGGRAGPDRGLPLNLGKFCLLTTPKTFYMLCQRKLHLNSAQTHLMELEVWYPVPRTYDNVYWTQSSKSSNRMWLSTCVQLAKQANKSHGGMTSAATGIFVPKYFRLSSGIPVGSRWN